MYLIDLYEDIKIWYRYAKITKSNRQKLEEKNLRVDWAGRIYTVVNLPDEVKNHPNAEMMVMQQLSPYNNLLLELGIADYSYPEVQKIDDPATNAYLVVMYPELNAINPWRIVLEVAKWAGIIILLKVCWSLCVEYGVFQGIANFISKYV